jgi:ParB/RepB/Spo0J family partition protein
MMTTTEKKAAPAKGSKKVPVRRVKPALASIANVVLVPLDDLVEVENIRTSMDEAGLIELAQDIEARGLLQPIVVTPAKGGKYAIVAGHRRAAAVRRTAATAVPAVVLKMAGAAVKAAQLAENVQREDLSLQEEGRALLALRNEGMSIGELADLVHKSRAWVCKRIACVEGLPWTVEGLIADGVTEDPEIILALKELCGLDWYSQKLAVDGLREGTENRETVRERLRQAKAPQQKVELTGEQDGAGRDTSVEDAEGGDEGGTKADPQRDAFEAMRKENYRKSLINRQCGMWQLFNMVTLKEDPTEEQFETYAVLEPEARAYWSEVISDALDSDLFPQLMKRAAIGAIEEEPDVLPVMLWVAMQPKPLPEREEDVLRGFVRDFRRVCVSHAKRE